MILDMYKGVANSPETTITNNINETDTIIYVLDETRIPGLPNLMVLGTGVSAETVKVLSIDGNAITVERGFQGIPKVWNAGTIIARNFTEYDYNALVENVKTLDADIGGLAGEGRTTETVKKNADDLDEHKAESASKHITESGSNANGNYIKFDDGTMICHTTILHNSLAVPSSDLVWTFPATFIDAYSIPVITPASIGYELWGVATGVLTTSMNYRVTSKTSITTNVRARLFALGRWK